MMVRLDIVAGGTEVVDECACGGDVTDATLLGLSEDGVTTLGLLSTCESCGLYFRCAYCMSVLAARGTAIHRHIMRHGEAAGA